MTFYISPHHLSHEGTVLSVLQKAACRHEPPKINLKPSLIDMMHRGPGSSTPTKCSGHQWSPGAKSITQKVPCLTSVTSNVLATVTILSLNVVLHVTHYSSLVSPSRCLVRQQQWATFSPRLPHVCPKAAAWTSCPAVLSLTWRHGLASPTLVKHRTFLCKTF